MDELYADPIAGLPLRPPAPPDDDIIRHWFFVGDAYQLMELVHGHEDEVDAMIDYLWNAGDRPARDVYASLAEFREAFAAASDRNGPRRLLEALVARHPARGRFLMLGLSLVERRESGNLNLDYSADKRRLRMVSMRARRPRGAVRRRGGRRRGAGRPGHRSGPRANSPPSDDDGGDPEADPEPDRVARHCRRAFCCPGVLL
jgi:hypothetical protein